MATIPAGATIRDRATGEPIGVTTEEIRLTGAATPDDGRRVALASLSQVTITLTCDCSRLIEAFRQAGKTAQMLARTIVRRVMPDALQAMRLQGLRAQAKRKGRPGWRHRYILPARYIRQAQERANDPANSPEPFAHRADPAPAADPTTQEP